MLCIYKQTNQPNIVSHVFSTFSKPKEVENSVCKDVADKVRLYKQLMQNHLLKC